MTQTGAQTQASRVQARVLIVDDDDDLAESMKELFEDAGCRVAMARNAREAIAHCSETQFDVSFLDIRLPGKNGVETLREIRALRPRARVVMMTGYSMEEMLNRAMDNGALAVLQKPFSMEVVLGLVRDALHRHAILFADGDQEFEQLAQGCLCAEGYRVHIAEGFSDIFRLTRRRWSDVVLINVRGFGRSLKAIVAELAERGAGLPVVIAASRDAIRAGGDSMFSGNAPKVTLLCRPCTEHDMRVVLQKVAKAVA